jgi:hypothetical protein
MRAGRLLVVAIAVVVAASANAAQTRKLRGWQVTRITMSATMSDQLSNPQEIVCDGGETRVISATTTNRLDVRPTRMHWWAIYYPGVRRVLPYGAPGTRAKMTNSTTITWGYAVDTDGGCTVKTSTCTRNRKLTEPLLFKADPYPVARGLVWVWWQRWHNVLWDTDLCIPSDVPQGHLYHDLPRDGGLVQFKQSKRDCRSCDPDPLSRTRYSTWMRAKRFHFGLSGSGQLAQKQGWDAMSGSYSYRLDTSLRQVYN